MDLTRNIPFLLILFALSAVELFAQTTSSAAQVVTFGVRRIALQTPAASYVAATVSQSPVKVTVGSQSRYQSAVELKTTNSVELFSSEEPATVAGVDSQRATSATNEANSFSSKSPITKSLPPSKLLVTLTE